MEYIEVKNLCAGYDKKAVIKEISFCLEKGQILTIIGPNGAGKSTILKTISGQLEVLGGRIYVDGHEMRQWSARERAKHMAVMLTDRSDIELMTCRELVAMGRYPYTNALGKLTDDDNAKINEALSLVKAVELASVDFSELSDGQKQRILLARAICQGTDILILDEPTVFLDIHYKLDILNILRRLAREKGTAIILSLHEIELAFKISDRILCVKGEEMSAFGTPEEIARDNIINKLFDIPRGCYDPMNGIIKLPEI